MSKKPANVGDMSGRLSVSTRCSTASSRGTSLLDRSTDESGEETSVSVVVEDETGSEEEVFKGLRG